MVRPKRKYIAAFLSLALLVGGLYAGFIFLRNLAFFSLEKIEISGVKKASPAEIEALMRVRRGENLFRLDLEEIRRRVETHPWVRRARVSRKLPRTLRVHIKEEEPVAITVLEERLYFLNEEGKAFAPASTKDLYQWPVVTVEEPGLLRTQAAFLRLLAWVKRKNLYLPCHENISQVQLYPDRILMITREGLKVRFEPGSYEKLRKDYLKLDKIITYLYRNRLYSQAELIRLDYPEGRALLAYRQDREER